MNRRRILIGAIALLAIGLAVVLYKFPRPKTEPAPKTAPVAESVPVRFLYMPSPHSELLKNLVNNGHLKHDGKIVLAEIGSNGDWRTAIHALECADAVVLAGCPLRRAAELVQRSGGGWYWICASTWDGAPEQDDRVAVHIVNARACWQFPALVAEVIDALTAARSAVSQMGGQNPKGLSYLNLEEANRRFAGELQGSAAQAFMAANLELVPPRHGAGEEMPKFTLPKGHDFDLNPKGQK
jgi:hypothetical protein